jgi:hypothetical protein
MSLKLGGSKSKSSSVTNTSSRSTTTPLVPGWASTAVQGAAERLNGLFGMDPVGFTPGANSLQTQAAGDAAGLTGSPWNFDRAADITRQAADTSWITPYLQAGPAPKVGGEGLLDNLQAYMSPYSKDVVDTALADYDFGAGQTRAQQDLDLAGAGAFGGSGAALTRAATEDAILRGRASTSANLRDQAFSRATSLSNLDADRRQQAQALNADLSLRDSAQKVGWGLAAGDQRLRAADQLGSLSSEFDANRRANVATQAQMGDALRQIDQQRAQAPIMHAQQLVAMLNGLPFNLFTGQQTESSGTESNKSKNSSLSFEVGKTA